jgi:Uncharacterised nucleotidyltransferase
MMKNEPDIRTEEKLLTELCRLNFSDAQTGKIIELVKSVSDWEHFAFLANEHGIVALVFHNLEKLGFLTAVPEKVASMLNNGLMLNISRNSFHISVISEIVRLLSEENIKTVLLKGMSLELSVYGNTGLRQMTDIDILLAMSDYKRARKILIENGYVSLPVKSLFHKPIIAYSGKHLPSLLKDGASIDIHLELFGETRNTLTKLIYETSTKIKVNEETAYIPSPQLFFLYLVKHLYSHEISNESQLRLYTDLVVLIEKYCDDIINYDLLSYTAEAGLSQVLAQRLKILRDLWGMTFPDWLDDFINKRDNPDSILEFVRFLKSPKNRSASGNAMIYRKTIHEIPGLHRKILFVLGDIFPTLTFMKNRYGCSSRVKAILYYPHRLGKLLWLVRRKA